MNGFVHFFCCVLVIDFFVLFFFLRLFSNTTQKLQIEAVETGEDKRLPSAGGRVYPESRETEATGREK